jgi:hypothetical protein
MNDKTSNTTDTEPTDETEGHGFKIGGGAGQDAPTDDTEGSGRFIPAPSTDVDDTEGSGGKWPAPSTVEPDRDTGGNA